MTTLVYAVALCSAWQVNLLSVGDALRFPSYNQAASQEKLANEHKEWVAWQWRYDRGEPMERVWERYYYDACWRCDTLELARHIAYWHDTRPDWTREWLQLLKERIGDQDYYAGQLPAPVPLWRYLPR